MIEIELTDLPKQRLKILRTVAWEIGRGAFPLPPVPTGSDRPANRNAGNRPTDSQKLRLMLLKLAFNWLNLPDCLDLAEAWLGLTSKEMTWSIRPHGHKMPLLFKGATGVIGH